MNLEEALAHKLLRVVPLQKSGWMEKYVDEKPVDYRTLLGQEVALVNFYGKFVYVRNKVVAPQTLTSATGLSLVHVDVPDKTLKAIPNVTINRSKFIKLTLDKDTLAETFVELSAVKNEFVDKFFSDLAIKVIDGETLTDVEAISLLVDSRTLTVFDYADIVKLTRDGVVYEIASGSTARGRLYLQEIRDGVTKPHALRLFSKEESDILSKAVHLQ